MITASLLLVAALSVDDLSTQDLKKYYWDCDTMFMKGEMGGHDVWTCVEITTEFQKRVFHDNKEMFLQYWRENRFKEWENRGYTHKDN